MRLSHMAAVVIIPPAEIWPPIQSIRQRYDRQIWRWMPHITLLYPFYQRADWPPAAAFSAACAPIAPFELELATFEFFQQPRGRFAIWLAPRPAAPVIALRDALGLAMPELAGELHAHSFRPHLSVGQAQGKPELAQRLESLRASWEPLRFAVAEIGLIWRGDPPNDKFQVGLRVKLGTDAA